MDRVKDILRSLRDGMAYVFSWLVICCVVVSLTSGNETISVTFLIKLFVLSLWGVISFIVCFRNGKTQKKGFVFSLTLFYILFIPAEIIMFYFMGVFSGWGNTGAWSIFGIIIVITYLISLLIDHFVMKRNADVYTQKMKDYILMNRQSDL